MINPLLQQFNQGLLEIRELFHQTGRLDDSNSKLDEITKLLCLEIVSVRDPGSKVPSLKDILEEYKNKQGFITSLNVALNIAAKSKLITNYDGESLLGTNPKFNLAESEEKLAKKLASIVLESFNGYLRETHSITSFDFLNEAFGHFIRENFRQNIEDAQYMTPLEVVNFMVNLGIKSLKSKNLPQSYRPIICDPSCGVGSFLTQFYRFWYVKDDLKITPILIGQDKVDRMARLSLLNLTLFGIEDGKISRGNSIYTGSPLDFYNEKCDLILTNPPFGARFLTSDLVTNSNINYFPCLDTVIQNREDYIDSELLFLDRYFSLLKPGGTLLAVLPDSVISASGLPEYLRQQIQKKWQISSITELPAVTFAQAGTRTKTCILEIEKKAPQNNLVFMSKAESLGFEVSSKKGVPYKKQQGKNELEPLFKAMSNAVIEYHQNQHKFMIISRQPSSVLVSQNTLVNQGWTPSHYSVNRIITLQDIENLANNNDFEIYTLDSLVTIKSKLGTRLSVSDQVKCISVLHVGDFGSLNMRELLEYEPKTSGKLCSPGDILFSKINPRIPRVLVVPELPFDLICSTEFEIMQPKIGYTAYEIMVLLLSEYSQNQIQSLTSGTSSSHNRIKTKELLSIKVAIPKKGTAKRQQYEQAIILFREANIRLNESNILLQNTWNTINSLMAS
jgi:type I restriction-modification system DNA methylase subunit